MLLLQQISKHCRLPPDAPHPANAPFLVSKSVLEKVVKAPRESRFSIQELADANYERRWPASNLHELPCVRLPYPVIWMEYLPRDRRDASERVGVGFCEWPDEPANIMGTVVVGHPVDAPSVFAAFHLKLDSSGAVIKSGFSPVVKNQDREISSVLSLTLSAIALLHCKGVEIVTYTVNRGVNARRARKGKRPLISYNTIKIDSVAPPRYRNKGGAVNGTEKALHTVRGHFKDYRSGPGKFGDPNKRGIYWHGPHLSGSGAKGVVVKDYAIGKKEQ